MYSLDWSVKIGKWKLKTLESVKIVRSVELLSDTATIVLPATVFNKSLEIEDKIKAGDSVLIKLGYDGKLKTEFEGYLKTITTDGGSIEIECEDLTYLYRVEMSDQTLKNVTVKQLLEKVNKAVASKKLGLSCDYDYTYSKFVIADATAYDVLKKIQEETKANIYVKDDTLHLHPPYSEIFGSVNFSFQKNIDRDGTDLKYKDEKDKKVLIVIEYTGADGKIHKLEKGATGGEKVKLQGGTSDVGSLQKQAENEYVSRCYTGYEGTIVSWLIPYVEAGYKVNISDGDYEYKNGTYYVVSVNSEFSKSGGKRTITLGKKLSNG